MKTKLFTQDFLQSVLVAMLCAIAMPHLSMAAGGLDGNVQGGLGATAKDIATNQLYSIPNLISAICYISGITMMGMGALKLKAHAENPSNEKLPPAIARLAVGGVITSLPVFSSWVAKSTSIGGTALSYSGFDKNAGF